VHGEREDGVVFLEDLCSAVALVNVTVDDHHALHRAFGLQRARRDRAVVEDAEAFAAVAEGVMRSSLCSKLVETIAPLTLRFRDARARSGYVKRSQPRPLPAIQRSRQERPLGAPCPLSGASGDCDPGNQYGLAIGSSSAG
jgi:hypothetical protein